MWHFDCKQLLILNVRFSFKSSNHFISARFLALPSLRTPALTPARSLSLIECWLVAFLTAVIVTYRGPMITDWSTDWLIISFSETLTVFQPPCFYRKWSVIDQHFVSTCLNSLKASVISVSVLKINQYWSSLNSWLSQMNSLVKQSIRRTV